MEVDIIRHGETDWNVMKKIQGSSDIPLNARGIQLAEWTRDGMKEAGICYDRIYTSPLIRAKRTAEILNENWGLELRVDERIREMNFGSYEGDSLLNGEFRDENIHAFFSKPSQYVPDQDGESFAEMEARVEDFLQTEVYPYRT